MDIISNLPLNVLDVILVRLPLKDAVRTSILSSKWRDKWVTISELVFNDSYGWPDCFEPKRLPSALCNLENLSVCINFEKSVSILGLLCLLRSSSGLLKLSLQIPRTTGFCAEDPSVAGVYWKAEKDLNCPMNNLLEVCITGVVGLAPELEFIKVLLANSPLLRKMTFTESCGNDKIFKELLQFKRASAEAEVFWI